MEDNKIIMFLGCIFIILLGFGILTHTTKNVTKLEETISFNEIYVVKCDVPIITSDAIPLECSVQYSHSELCPEMIASTVDLINTRLKLEIRLFAREYCRNDFINNREEILNRIRAIPQKFKNRLPPDFSWEVLDVTIKL